MRALFDSSEKEVYYFFLTILYNETNFNINCSTKCHVIYFVISTEWLSPGICIRTELVICYNNREQKRCHYLYLLWLNHLRYLKSLKATIFSQATTLYALKEESRTDRIYFFEAMSLSCHMHIHEYDLNMKTALSL